MDNNLKERRLELGFTQSQVSAWLRSIDDRYDVSMVSRLECGVCLPSPEVLEGLCEVLQAPSLALYGVCELGSINLLAEMEAPAEELPAPVQRVVNLIPAGKENAVSRKYLETVSGMPDRIVRRQIEIARGLGVLICNGQDGAGYYIADINDIEDIERNYWQERSRALSILYRLKYHRRLLKAAGRRVS